MINLLIKKNEKYFIIKINNGIIHYADSEAKTIWGGELQYLPPDPNAKKRVLMSRNRIPQFFLGLLEIAPEELKEFEACKSDEQLYKVVYRDLLKNSCQIVKEERNE